MSDNLQNANTVEEEVSEQSVLPSDSSEQEAQANRLDLTSYVDENGKLAGKFESAEDLMKSYNEAQEYIKKINADRAREGNENAKAERQQEVEQTRSQVLDKLTTEFVNGNASEETINAAKELGMTDAEIKVKEYETREAIDKIVKHVGSMETYNTMVETLASQLTDSEKAEFNKMANNPSMSEIGLLGLQAKYNQLTGGTVDNDRIRGNTSGETTRGYQSQAEMMQDLTKLRANPNNKALQTAYERKKSMTSDDVFYGRK